MDTPHLPTEIIQRILTEIWNGDLSIDERIIFMTSSLLVNKTWFSVFTRVASKNVHIPCPSYADQYFRILREESPIYLGDIKSLPNHLCRTLKFHLVNAPAYPDPNISGVQSALVLANTLYTIRTLGYLPNLRKVLIEYVNDSFNDLVDQYRLVAFPDQVTDLELKYSFHVDTPPWLIGALRSKYERRDCLPWCLPSIRHLSIQGVGSGFVADLLSVCPQIETFETDAVFPIDDIAPLPSSVHTLVLRPPVNIHLSRQEIKKPPAHGSAGQGNFLVSSSKNCLYGCICCGPESF